MTCMVTCNSKGQLGATDLSDSIRAAEVGKTITPMGKAQQP